MKPSILFIVIFLFGVQLMSAQSRLAGEVLDAKNQPIFFATVALYNAADSQLVEAVSSDNDGVFTFESIENGRYYLHANMLGYSDKHILDIVMPGSYKKPITITLEEDATLLETVEITEKLPLMEQRADKLIINVEGNVTNTGGSLLDVMKKVPGMVVVQGRISLAGSGTPTILLNGKSTQYMDIESLLKDMPGDNIKKVEIIHQPGAEYEATGSGPILNIIMKKNTLFGTNGNVTLGVGKGELWDYTTGVNLSHYAGKININGGLGFSRNASVEGLEITRRLNGISNNVDGVYDQVNRNAETPNSFRTNLGIDYDIHEKHRIGFIGKLITSNNAYIATSNTDVDLLNNLEQDYKLSTDNDIDRSWNYYSINPYYVFEIDTQGQKIEVDVNLARYKVDGQNTLSTTSTLNSILDQQRYTQPGDTKIFATKLDYSIPLTSGVDLKIGAKYSFADLDNDLQSEYFEDNKWNNNAQQSNHYLFEEKVYAGYGKLDWSHDEWSGTLGLRYENSQSRGYSITLDSALNRDISKFFPSFSLTRKLGKSLASSVSYSYRINRPSYSSLNPFVYYLDPFTYETGNPTLRPELTHSAKFTLTYDGQPFFNVEYKKSSDAIVEITQQEKNSQEAFKTDVNFDDRTQFSATLIFPLSFIKGIDGYGGVVVSKTMYDSQLEGSNFNRNRWTPTAFIQVEFDLPGDIQAEVGGWYQGRSQEGIFDAEYLFGTSAGISKKIMNDRAKISLGVEDFANRFWHSNVNYQQDMDLISTWQAPVVSARFSYKFGNQFLHSKKTRRGSASEEIRRATSD